MAIWQFSFNIVPNGRNLENSNEKGILSWTDKQIRINTNLLLSEKKSWCEDIKLFGDEESTCIEFFIENENVKEISCRLDLRNLRRNQLEIILKYIRDIGGKIFYENQIYEANIYEIIPLIKNSIAYKFCKEPKKFFEELSLDK